MTVPVGVPEAALTAEVNVTVCPKTEGFSEETSEVVVLLVTT